MGSTTLTLNRKLYICEMLVKCKLFPLAKIAKLNNDVPAKHREVQYLQKFLPTKNFKGVTACLKNVKKKKRKNFLKKKIYI